MSLRIPESVFSSCYILRLIMIFFVFIFIKKQAEVYQINFMTNNKTNRGIHFEKPSNYALMIKF